MTSGIPAVAVWLVAGCAAPDAPFVGTPPLGKLPKSTTSFDAAVTLSTQPGSSPNHRAAAADLDLDGDLDLISSVQFGELTWQENLGAGLFAAPQPVGAGTGQIHAADLDGDGDPDLLDGHGGWHENLGGGTFAPHLLPYDFGAESITTADLDGDGDADVLVAEYWEPPVFWFENLGAGTFSERLDIPTPVGFEVRGLGAAAGDLDGDGDLDVVSSTEGWGGDLVWHENVGGGSFPDFELVGGRSTSVQTVDLDGDGDLDLLAGLAWYENLGGGSFGPSQAIHGDESGLRCSLAADLDGDGDADVVSAGFDQEIAWFEADGGGFGPRQVLTASNGGVSCVAVADLDDDGCLDVLAALGGTDAGGESELLWFRNARTDCTAPATATGTGDTGADTGLDTAPGTALDTSTDTGSPGGSTAETGSRATGDTAGGDTARPLDEEASEPRRCGCEAGAARWPWRPWVRRRTPG